MERKRRTSSPDSSEDESQDSDSSDNSSRKISKKRTQIKKRGKRNRTSGSDSSSDNTNSRKTRRQSKTTNKKSLKKNRDTIADMENENIKLQEAIANPSVMLDTKIDDSKKKLQKLQSEIENIRTKVGKTDMNSLRVRRSELQVENDKYQRGVDLLFVMDCTGSMGSWIKVTVEKILLIAEQARELYSNIILRIGFIGYRDIDDNGRIEICDFSEDIESVRIFINRMRAYGGGDAPEDIAGALNSALTITWKSVTRLLIHFADAPCHGRKYHNVNDTYPDGDPDGLNIEDIVVELGNKKRVDYYFGRINSTTDIMTNIFQELYQNTKRSFTRLELGTSVGEFLPKVLQSITASMRASIMRNEMDKPMTGLLM